MSTSTKTAPGMLDEAALRGVFPDAPASMALPENVRSLHRARLRTFRQRHPVLVFIWAAIIAATVFALMIGRSDLSIGLAIFALLCLTFVYFYQRSSAQEDFLRMYAASRGLEMSSLAVMAPVVPLLCQGDTRRWPIHMAGQIAGQPGELAHFTWVDVSYDSEGNRSETNHEFTIVQLQLPDAVAARYPGVAVSPAGLLKSGNVGSLRNDRKVEFESARFHDRYRVHVDKQQDDVALYELFSTTFLEQLSEDVIVYWQQQGTYLVCWMSKHRFGAEELDGLCHGAARVLQRYLEEYR